MTSLQYNIDICYTFLDISVWPFHLIQPVHISTIHKRRYTQPTNPVGVPTPTGCWEQMQV